MEKRDDPADSWPEDLEACVRFHGHLCPGLIYGFLVAKAGIERMGIERSKDEEVVVIAESDSCAIDALQVMLGACLLYTSDAADDLYTV